MTWLILLAKGVFLTTDYCDCKLLNLCFSYSYDAIASWATNLKTSIRKANKALWLSVALIVLFAALMSFLTGRFFQKSVDAAPTQDGDSCVSLEHILWSFTRLRHNGPPPVWLQHILMCVSWFLTFQYLNCINLVTFAWEIRAWNRRFSEWL